MTTNGRLRMRVSENNSMPSYQRSNRQLLSDNESQASFNGKQRLPGPQIQRVNNVIDADRGSITSSRRSHCSAASRHSNQSDVALNFVLHLQETNVQQSEVAAKQQEMLLQNAAAERADSARRTDNLIKTIIDQQQQHLVQVTSAAASTSTVHQPPIEVMVSKVVEAVETAKS